MADHMTLSYCFIFYFVAATYRLVCPGLNPLSRNLTYALVHLTCTVDWVSPVAQFGDAPGKCSVHRINQLIFSTCLMRRFQLAQAGHSIETVNGENFL